MRGSARRIRIGLVVAVSLGAVAWGAAPAVGRPPLTLHWGTGEPVRPGETFYPETLIVLYAKQGHAFCSAPDTSNYETEWLGLVDVTNMQPQDALESLGAGHQECESTLPAGPSAVASLLATGSPGELLVKGHGASLKPTSPTYLEVLWSGAGQPCRWSVGTLHGKVVGPYVVEFKKQPVHPIPPDSGCPTGLKLTLSLGPNAQRGNGLEGVAW